MGPKAVYFGTVDTVVSSFAHSFRAGPTRSVASLGRTVTYVVIYCRSWFECVGGGGSGGGGA